LIVLLPLALVLSILDVAFFRVVPEVSYSATYAVKTANAMLLFLIGMSVFYTGEAMHRDRELRIEPVIWATPAPNHVLLLSKFLATLVLTLSFITLTGVVAITTQLIRRHPIEIQPYLFTYSIILIPGVVFLAGLFGYVECSAAQQVSRLCDNHRNRRRTLLFLQHRFQPLVIQSDALSSLELREFDRRKSDHDSGSKVLLVSAGRMLPVAGASLLPAEINRTVARLRRAASTGLKPL
jgi:hypothetical protein